MLDLFSGIGGFSLGLTRAGFRTTAFCEIEEYPRSILRKHWPDVPIFEDVRTLHAKDLPEAVELICGGFPCQPFSVAGKRRGKDDDRHLWPEIVRLVRELSTTTGKPTWGLFENVAGHVGMGLDTVLSDLEGEGYACWPLIIPACAVNAPHRRDRVWILAHASGAGCKKRDTAALPDQQGLCAWGGNEGDAAHTEKLKCHVRESAKNSRKGKIQLQVGGVCSKKSASQTESQSRGVFQPWFSANATSSSDWRGQAAEWITLPGVCAGDARLPSRVARLKALGNAVVPQIPELIGRAIMAASAINKT